jgi:hypothetical protein
VLALFRPADDQEHASSVLRQALPPIFPGELRASLSFEDALALVSQRFFEGRHAAVS